MDEIFEEILSNCLLWQGVHSFRFW